MTVLAVALGALVDRSVQLIRARHEHRKSIFDNCVKPLYDAVDVVHTNYTQTFGEYRVMVRACQVPDDVTTLFDRIAGDMSLTTPLRIKIAKLRLNATHPEVRTYRDRIREYLRCIVRSHREAEYDNGARLQLIAELDRLLRAPAEISPVARRRAEIVIARQLSSLDSRYAGVVDEYEVLHKQQIL
jgi:hypothetical protein